MPASAPKQQTAKQQSIGSVAILVREYQEARNYFTVTLGFDIVEDTPVEAGGARRLVVAPPGSSGTRIHLVKASTPDELLRVGDQAGGSVFLILHTDDFQRDYDLFRSRGVAFLEPPRQETYGTVAVFEDLYGNRWDLLQTNPSSGPRSASWPPAPAAH